MDQNEVRKEGGNGVSWQREETEEREMSDVFEKRKIILRFWLNFVKGRNF